MLEIDRLSKTYPDGTTALQDVSFSVNRGEFLV
ncbi:MAG: ABC transporter, partial [Nitrospinaceae bacterium]|nr:ABC transporter [Nitrospinaceae bacterium]